MRKTASGGGKAPYCHRCDGVGVRLYERKGIYEKGHVKRAYLPFGWLCVKCEEWISVEDWVRQVYEWKKEY